MTSSAETFSELRANGWTFGPSNAKRPWDEQVHVGSGRPAAETFRSLAGNLQSYRRIVFGGNNPASGCEGPVVALTSRQRRGSDVHDKKIVVH